MVWRGSPSNQDKFFACLVYLIPLLEVLPIGFYIYLILPPVGAVAALLLPLYAVYNLNVGGIAIIAWGIFLALYAGVVRSYKYVHFLRYNVMQSILLGIFASLCTSSLSLFNISVELIANPDNSANFLITTIYTAIFLLIVCSCLYSIFQCIQGLYPELPIISDAAHSQVR